MGKNLVSDGHFCKSFCPAQPKISISSNWKHCYHLLTYPDCVYVRNSWSIAKWNIENSINNGCVSDGIPIYHAKKWAVWKNIAPKLANNYYFHKLMSVHIPVANVFQCFSIQMLFWVSCYRLDKKICLCPSLTQAVSITDAKSLRPIQGISSAWN